MPDSPSSILPPPGEVNVLPAEVQHVAGGDRALTGVSWNDRGHVALSIHGEGVRLLADPAELRVVARILDAIAAEVDAREGRTAAAPPPLPPEGRALDVPLTDSFIETVRQAAGAPRTGVTVSAPGALTLMAGGEGLRLTFRDRGDVAQLHAALETIDAHLAGLADTAGAALASLLAREVSGHG